MPRAKLLIDRVELLQQLNQAEELETFRNYSHLFEHVSMTDWGQNIPKSNGATGVATASVIYQRVKEWSLFGDLKTQRGEKGGGFRKGVNAPREKRSAKFKKIKNIDEVENDLRESMGRDYDGLVSKVIGGSMASAVKAKCLECTCNQVGEIRDCRILGCPLYLYRPYKTKD